MSIQRRSQQAMDDVLDVIVQAEKDGQPVDPQTLLPTVVAPSMPEPLKDAPRTTKQP